MLTRQCRQENFRRWVLWVAGRRYVIFFITYILSCLGEATSKAYADKYTHLFLHRANIKSSGLFQEALASLYLNPKMCVNERKRVLESMMADLGVDFIAEVKGGLKGITMENSLKEFDECGYSILPFSLSEESIDRTIARTRRSQFVNHRDDNDSYASCSWEMKPRDARMSQVFWGKSRGRNYDECPIDISFLDKAAKAYLGTEYVYLYQCSTMISYASNKDSSECAQLYHYDLEGLKWVKFFVYLTDSHDMDCGPHMAITHSFRPELKRRFASRDQSYRRLTQQEVEAAMIQPMTERVFYGSKGTIIVANTSCYHKGVAPRKGERIILELTYSISPMQASY